VGITYTVYNREDKEYFDLGKLVKIGDQVRFHEESILIDYIFYKFKFSSSISIEIISDYVDEFETESYVNLDEVFIPKSPLTDDLKLIVDLPEFNIIQLINKVNNLLSIVYKYINSNSSLLIELTRE
jgi:hypothetical protein